MRRIRWILLLAPLLMAHQCGPTAEQAATAGLVSVFLAHCAVGILLWVLVALWNRVQPSKTDWTGWWRVSVGALIIAAVALLAGPAGSAEWTGPGVIIVGSFMLLYTLILWRMRRAQSNAVLVASLVVGLVACLPAVAMFATGKDDYILVWAFGSGVMWGGPGVFLALLIEAFVRFLRAE